MKTRSALWRRLVCIAGLLPSFACGRSELGQPTGGAASATGGAGGAITSTGTADAAAGGGMTSAGGAGGKGGGAQGGAGGRTFETGPLPACTKLEIPPVVDGCLRPAGSALPSNRWTPRAWVLSGTITQVGRGPDEDTCLWPPSSSSSDSVVLGLRSVSDAGSAEWQVEYRIPRSAVAWKVGDQVDVSYAGDGGGWVAVRSHLMLARAGVLEVYAGRSSTIDELQEAPYDWYRGADACVEDEQHFTWAYSRIDIKTSTGWAQVHHGGTVQLRDYQITNGGVVAVLWRDPEIMDGMFPEVAVGVARLPR